MRRAATLLLLLICLVCNPRVQAAPSPVTSFRQMTADLRADALRSPWVSLASAGKSVHGRPLWLVRLRDPAVPTAQTVRLLVMCRQHGDEPASTEAFLGLINQVAGGTNPALRADLRHVTLYVVPMVNPDGAELGTRLNAARADLNRDWGPFTQPETRAMSRLLPALRPALVVDAHNWDSGDEYNADCLEIHRASYTALGQAEVDLQQASVQSLDAQGYHVQSFAYGPDSDPRLAHRYCTHLGVPSMLVETHAGSPQDTADYQKRRQMYVALARFLVHRYALPSPAALRAAQKLAPAPFAAVREAALFPLAAAHLPARTASAHSAPTPSRAWLWALCAYVLALAAWGVTKSSHAASPVPGSSTARTPGYIPASERRSADRRDKPRYRHSPSAPVFRPAPGACAHKPQTRSRGKSLPSRAAEFCPPASAQWHLR